MTDPRIPDFMRKAEAKAQATIGKSIKVKHDSKNFTVGEIAAVRVERVRYAGRSILAVYTVDLLCGTNKVPRTFDLTSITI